MKNVHFYLYILFIVLVCIKIIRLSNKGNWDAVSFLIILCFMTSGFYYIVNYNYKFSQKETLLWKEIDKKLVVYKKRIENNYLNQAKNLVLEVGDVKESLYELDKDDSFIILSKSNMIQINLINEGNWIENNLFTRGGNVPSKYVLIYSSEEKKWNCTVDVDFSDLRPDLKTIYSKYIEHCIVVKNS